MLLTTICDADLALVHIDSIWDTDSPMIWILIFFGVMEYRDTPKGELIYPDEKQVGLFVRSVHHHPQNWDLSTSTRI
jgi:hypothetical protein